MAGGGNVPNPARALPSPSRAPSAAPRRLVPHTLCPAGMSLWTRATGPRALQGTVAKPSHLDGRNPLGCDGELQLHGHDLQFEQVVEAG